MSEALTVIERNNLVELEETIQKNLTAFYEVGFALMQIRDNRLYREIYGTFEEYCQAKWNMSRPRAYQLIKAAEVKDNLSTIVDSPINEAQSRPLTRIKDPAEQREVYQRAVETAPEGKVTAKHIEETVREVIERKEPEKKVYQIHPVSDAMTFAGMAISQLERIRDDDPKRKDGIREVRDWCNKELHQ